MKPCLDGNNVEDLGQDEIITNHNHHSGNDDSCPITCICNCCGIAITYVSIQTFNLKLSEKTSTQVYSNYQSNYRFYFHSNIWQPPQLIS